MRIDAVYSSPILRAKRTAELILQEAKCDLPICDEPRLAERCFGVFEGLRWPEVEDRYPAELAPGGGLVGHEGEGVVEDPPRPTELKKKRSSGARVLAGMRSWMSS